MNCVFISFVSAEIVLECELKTSSSLALFFSLIIKTDGKMVGLRAVVNLLCILRCLHMKSVVQE